MAGVKRVFLPVLGCASVGAVEIHKLKFQSRGADESGMQSALLESQIEDFVASVADAASEVTGLDALAKQASDACGASAEAATKLYGLESTDFADFALSAAGECVTAVAALKPSVWALYALVSASSEKISNLQKASATFESDYSELAELRPLLQSAKQDSQLGRASLEEIERMAGLAKENAQAAKDDPLLGQSSAAAYDKSHALKVMDEFGVSKLLESTLVETLREVDVAAHAYLYPVEDFNVVMRQAILRAFPAPGQGDLVANAWEQLPKDSQKAFLAVGFLRAAIGQFKDGANQLKAGAGQVSSAPTLDLKIAAAQQVAGGIAELKGKGAKVKQYAVGMKTFTRKAIWAEDATLYANNADIAVTRVCDGVAVADASGAEVVQLANSVVGEYGKSPEEGDAAANSVSAAVTAIHAFGSIVYNDNSAKALSNMADWCGPRCKAPCNESRCGAALNGMFDTLGAPGASLAQFMEGVIAGTIPPPS